MKKFYSFLIFNALVFLVSAQIPFENKTLVDKEVHSGSYEITIDGSNLASGTYFVRMISQNNQQTIKISLIK